VYRGNNTFWKHANEMCNYFWNDNEIHGPSAGKELAGMQGVLTYSTTLFRTSFAHTETWHPHFTDTCFNIIPIPMAKSPMRFPTKNLILTFQFCYSHITIFDILIIRIQQSVLRPATDWTIQRSTADGEETFCTDPDRPCGPPTMGTGSLPRGQSGRGMALTTHPHPALRLKKE